MPSSDMTAERIHRGPWETTSWLTVDARIYRNRAIKAHLDGRSNTGDGEAVQGRLIDLLSQTTPPSVLQRTAKAFPRYIDSIGFFRNL